MSSSGRRPPGLTSPPPLVLAVLVAVLAVVLAAADTSDTASSAALGAAGASLANLLQPTFERVVQSALDRRQDCAAERSATVAAELSRLNKRLDDVIDNCRLQTTSELNCVKRPAPTSQDPTGAYQRDGAARACARSCQQLRDEGGSPQDGVYWLTGLTSPVYCDFSHDGGGWTLLLTAVSRRGWDRQTVLGRNEHSPSLEDNYSILGHGDALRDLGDSDQFAYRIEAQAEKGRQRWGGVWFAPRNYTFVDDTGLQVDVNLVRKFDDWHYKDRGIEQRMPWLRGGEDTVLSTSDTDGYWGGTLVTSREHTGTFWQHSPWIDTPGGLHSGTILYWMRENAL